MFRDTPAYSGFAVSDISQAKDFYEKQLGLNVTDEHGMLGLHLASGATVLIYPKEDHTPATFTILNFPVTNIEQVVDDLTAAGVRFERFEGSGLQTDERGIHHGDGGPKIAWFRDPAGNILSVLEG
jgi:catechol 2,3-dioxygenase-like lactoylglutathione lyase family enzyme